VKIRATFSGQTGPNQEKSVGIPYTKAHTLHFNKKANAFTGETHHLRDAALRKPYESPLARHIERSPSNTKDAETGGSRRKIGVWRGGRVGKGVAFAAEAKGADQRRWYEAEIRKRAEWVPT